tara:strand:+ start:6000 stop:6521 length:522 start_codon:yes stop_codon:yes gene_type:complete
MSTTNKIAEVIRKIVREEVRKEVRIALNEQTKQKVTKKAAKSGLRHALGLQDGIERRARAPKKSQQFTKNKMLNDILNETAGEIRGSASDAIDYETMGGGSFTSNNAQTFDRKSLASKMGYGDNTSTGAPSLSEMVPNVDTRGMTNQGIQVDDAVAKALTRDYSELVKKFKKN